MDCQGSPSGILVKKLSRRKLKPSGGSFGGAVPSFLTTDLSPWRRSGTKQVDLGGSRGFGSCLPAQGPGPASQLGSSREHLLWNGVFCVGSVPFFFEVLQCLALPLKMYSWLIVYLTFSRYTFCSVLSTQNNNEFLFCHVNQITCHITL